MDEHPQENRRWSLAVAILGSTMAFLDGTVVNVALPVMQQRLGATIAEVQWIVEAYALFLAALVLVGGALGDRFGRRRIFVAGTALFATASAACAAAPGATTLIVARAVQGVGAALLVPGSLALVSAAYPEKERGAAIGTWSAASAITTGLGPVLGGWLVGHASWRWIFVINVPLAAGVLLASRRVTETRDPDAPSAIDLAGASLAVLGLGTLVYALLDSTSLGLVVAAVVILGAFVVVEARRKAPMVPLSMFRNRTFAATNILTLLLYAALGGAMFFLPFDLIQIQGYSPAAAGASLLPLVVLLSVMSPFAGRFVERFGPRLPLVVGPALAAGGFALFALLGSAAVNVGSYFTAVFPGVFVLGVGMGLTVAPLTATVMGAVDRRHAGVASGINNAVSRVAGLVAIAALGVVLRARFDRGLDCELATMSLTPDERAVVDRQRASLASMDLSTLAPEKERAVRGHVESAYLAGFRAVMLLASALALGSALAGGVVTRRR